MVVSATTNAGTPVNALSLMSFTAATNARLDIGVDICRLPLYVMHLLPGTQALTVYVAREPTGQASPLTLTVTDRCGERPGGPGAF